MAKISYSRAFDISRQFYFGDWTGASISATATALTMNLGGARIVLGGSFTVAGTLPTAGTITSLTYSTVGATPVTEFSVTGISMSYGSFMDAMADGDFNAVAGNGADWITGSAGGDKIYGGAGNDKLEGLAGNDSLFGGGGNDTLDGGAGNDSMQGGTGNDIYIVDSLLDKVIESAGGGMDGIRTALASYTLGAEIENLQFTTTANASGAGNALANLLTGGRGNDSLSGLDGNDTLRGGMGHDTLAGGNGNDLLVGDNAGNSAPVVANGVSSSQPLTLSMVLGDVSATNSTMVSGFISLSSQVKDSFNVAVLLDVSGDSAGVSRLQVNDVNGDGIWNQKLDVEIDSFIKLVSNLQATGLGDKVRVALIANGSNINAVGVPSADLNGNGISDLVEAAQKLRMENSTNFFTSLSLAKAFFDESPGAENLLLCVGGESIQPYVSYDDALQALRNPAGINASIRTMDFRVPGTFDSGNALDKLDKLDNGLVDHTALNAATPAALAAGLAASRVNISDISRLEIYKNGILVSTLTPSQLVETPLGLRYAAPVAGLNPAGLDEIETRLIFKGTTAPVYASQIIGGGNQVFNDSLMGGAGDDTLDGNAGVDTLAGGLGNDVYRIGNNAAVIEELAGQGTDGIEVARSFSLNNTAYQNIENLKLLGFANIDATGNANNNLIVGNAGNNILNGLSGNDTLIGGLGFDIVNYSGAAQAMAVSLELGRASDYLAMNAVLGPNPGPSTGLPVVIIKSDWISGVEGIWGSAFGDWLAGSNGDDIIRGNGGNDTIFGGDGFDTLDYSTATAGMTVSLREFRDSFYPVGQAQCANGSQGTDRIESGVEGVVGSAYNDNISCGGQYINAKLQGGAGNDTLTGGSASDTLIGGTGKNVIDGGSGSDWVDYSAATEAVSGSLLSGRLSVGTTGATVDTISAVENFILSAYADSIVGSASDEYMDGGAGNDTLVGGDGNDTLRGGTGADNMAGGAGSDVYYVDSVDDVVTEAVNGGVDTIYVSAAAGSFVRTFNGVENIYLAGNAAFNVSGGVEQNAFYGTEGNDTFNGGAGADHDTMTGGNGIDWVSYADHRTGVLGSLGYYGFGSEIDGDSLYSIENFQGSAFADSVSGNELANILVGGAGNDTLAGETGDDTLIGGEGNDSLDGGEGFNTVSYANLTKAVRVDLGTGIAVSASDGTDTLINIRNIIGGAGNDVISWTTTSNTTYLASDCRLEGGAGNDSLTGGAGDDTLVGGAGDDVLDGGATIFGYGGIADVADYSSATAAVVADLAAGTATGGAGNDRLISIERLVGSDFADKLTGKARPESEYFWGGAGADTLDGGADNYADYFCYIRVSDSTATAMDAIKYRAGDVINLQAIEADGPGLGDGSFTFRGASQFSGGTGELRYAVIGSDTYIYADVDGNRVADMTIKLAGAFTLTATNFWL